MGRPTPEPRRLRARARRGGVIALVAFGAYLVWRIGFSLPTTGAGRFAAWGLVALEVVAFVGLIVQVVTMWTLHSDAPRRITRGSPHPATVVLITTYNEPLDIIAPTIAAACAIEPAHATWVLDDGDRPWVETLCRQYGARYVRRETHEHAKAGNINHALELMQREAERGGPDYEVVAFLDCDHVPLPGFLTETLGWFDDPDLALVQAPQTYYNDGAFDDDGASGEQGLFFHVQLPSRNGGDAGAFWCGSTALIRREALHNIGGVATTTIVEDLHTTLLLMRLGWKSVYHHQTLALGLAPETAASYLLQRRRWALGSMQVLAYEGLVRAKRGLSWRTYREFLAATVWWLEGVATCALLLLPVGLMLAGTTTSTAPAWQFTAVFTAAFGIRLWGVRRLYRNQIRWSSAFAFRVIRIPIGLACLRWWLTRRMLRFDVTPKSAAAERVVGRIPASIVVLLAVTNGLLGYAILGLAGVVPWQSSLPSTVASASWIVVGDIALILAAVRIRRSLFASSRRSAHRFELAVPVTVQGQHGVLIDVSVGGLAVRFDADSPPRGHVTVSLPGAASLVARSVSERVVPGGRIASYRIEPEDLASLRTMSLWLFHTPVEVFPGLPRGVPLIAAA